MRWSRLRGDVSVMLASARGGRPSGCRYLEGTGSADAYGCARRALGAAACICRVFRTVISNSITLGAWFLFGRCFLHWQLVGLGRGMMGIWFRRRRGIRVRDILSIALGSVDSPGAWLGIGGFSRGILGIWGWSRSGLPGVGRKRCICLRR